MVTREEICRRNQCPHLRSGRWGRRGIQDRGVKVADGFVPQLAIAGICTLFGFPDKIGRLSRPVVAEEATDRHVGKPFFEHR